MSRIYIAGPMTGYAEYNYPAFLAAAEEWRKEGWEVLNPAENFGGDKTKDYATYIRADLQMLAQADAMAFLPGWERSKGATFEHSVGSMLGLPMYDAVSMGRLQEESPLAEGDRLVSGDRQTSYGHPIEDFTRTGRMWGAILGVPDVDPALVGLCMAALKISRECHRPKRDNLTDLAGYAKTVWLVRQRQAATP